MKELKLNEIDTSIQIRYRMDVATVAEYAQAMKDGVVFPPLDVFSDGGDFVLVDGQHRLSAAELIKKKSFLCKVRRGDRAAALRFALGANSAHGLRRTNADKRKCVLLAMNEPDYAKLSNRKLAELCNVSRMLVKEIKDEIAEKAAESEDDPTSNSKTKDRVRKTKKKQTQEQIDRDELRGALAIIRGFPYSGLDANEKLALTDDDVFSINYVRTWLKELLG